MVTSTLVRRTLLLIVLTAGVGCASYVFAVEAVSGDKIATTNPVAEVQAPEKVTAPGADLPRELSMRPLPAYRIEPPDILQIEITSSKVVRSSESQSSSQPEQGAPSSDPGTATGSASSTKTGSGTLTLSGTNTYFGTKSISGGQPQTGGATTVTGGTITYVGETNTGGGTLVISANTNPGKVWDSVADGQIVAARSPVTRNIERTVFRIPRVQPGSGQYLVGPDGTINLRQYGTVQVMGMTIAEVKAALEKHLAKYLESPEVTLDVLGYNSKVYYIITDGAGYGDNVRRIPISGNETVLDAVAAVGGLSQLSSKKMWLVRPTPTDPEKGMSLPIDYEAITQRGATATNYQVMPGDRIFIAGDSAIALNNKISKTTAPVERMLGMISLWASTVRSLLFLPRPAYW